MKTESMCPFMQIVEVPVVIIKLITEIICSALE